jgi:hypothetical protein
MGADRIILKTVPGRKLYQIISFQEYIWALLILLIALEILGMKEF